MLRGVFLCRISCSGLVAFLMYSVHCVASSRYHALSLLFGSLLFAFRLGCTVYACDSACVDIHAVVDSVVCVTRRVEYVGFFLFVSAVFANWRCAPGRSMGA